MLVYPLKAVVTSDAALARAYNGDSTSMLLTSECLTPQAVKELIAGGAQFEKIVSTNGEGEDLIGELLMNAQGNGMDGLPQFERIFFSAGENVESILKLIHGACSGDEIKGFSSNFQVSG